MISKFKIILLILSASIFTVPIYAHDILVSGVWSLAPPPTSKNGAVYLLIKNKGAEEDMLIGAKTNVAKKVELHTTSHDHGQMKMHHNHSFKIPGDGSLEMKPGGHHIMLMGLVQPLTPGQRFELTLNFMKVGDIITEVVVVETPPTN